MRDQLAIITDLARRVLALERTRDGNPVGTIIDWSGPPAAPLPGGYLLADGSAVSRTQYARLFKLYGTFYGAGDGSTTFNLPNRKGRMAIGQDVAQTEFDVIGETGGAKAVTLTAAQSGVPAHTHGVTNGTVPSAVHTHGDGSLAATIAFGTSGGIRLTALGASVNYTSNRTINLSGVTGGTTQAETVGTDVQGSTGTPSATQDVSVNASAATDASAAHPNLPPYMVTRYLVKT